MGWANLGHSFIRSLQSLLLQAGLEELRKSADLGIRSSLDKINFHESKRQILVGQCWVTFEMVLNYEENNLSWVNCHIYVIICKRKTGGNFETCSEFSKKQHFVCDLLSYVTSWHTSHLTGEVDRAEVELKLVQEEKEETKAEAVIERNERMWVTTGIESSILFLTVFVFV